MDGTRETLSERKERYLRYASEAEISAFRCGDAGIRDGYVNIAKSWTALAGELLVPANDCLNPASGGLHASEPLQPPSDPL